MDVTRIHRLLRLITLLQSGEARSVDELIEELNVSRRTLFRDLNALKDAGIPAYHDRPKGYRIDQNFYLPPISLTVPEALGLMNLAKTAAGQRERPLMPAALSAIYKLISNVHEPIRSICAEVMSTVTVDPGRQLTENVESNYYLVLQQAISEEKSVDFTYQSPVDHDQEIRGVMHPYQLHFANHAWYVFGWTDTFNDVRMYKLIRFNSIEPDKGKFTRPDTFDASNVIGDAWQFAPEGEIYNIELIFSPKVGTNVAEVQWHKSQQHEMQDDGSCCIQFSVDGLQEIAWWICGYADQVKIVNPPELRQLVHDKLSRAVENHKAAD